MRIRSLLASAVQSHPASWKLAWETVRHVPFLQPHDPSYRAVRHFVAARPRGLLLDIGANDGMSSAYFRRIAPGAPILAIEPNGLHETRLRAMKLRDPLFDFRIAACSDTQGTLTLFTPHYRGIALHTFSCASVEDARRAIAEAFGDAIARTATFTEQTSAIVRIDDMGLSPAVIKIDAEGHDGRICRGAADTLARCRPFMVIEASPDIDSRWFGDLGYVLHDYDVASDRFVDLTPKPRTESGQRNMFAIPSELVRTVSAGR